MLRKEGGNVYAILIDLDLAVNVDAQSPSSKHRMGTKPFTAIDLLSEESTEHLHRHDLESLFYVVVWITSRFQDGKEIPNTPLQGWAEGKHQRVVDSKSAFLSTLAPLPTKGFASFGRHIYRLRRMFHDGCEARTKAIEDSILDSGLEGGPKTSQFANDMLGGFVTFDTFQRILDTDLP